MKSTQNNPQIMSHKFPQEDQEDSWEINLANHKLLEKGLTPTKASQKSTCMTQVFQWHQHCCYFYSASVLTESSWHLHKGRVSFRPT